MLLKFAKSLTKVVRFYVMIVWFCSDEFRMIEFDEIFMFASKTFSCLQNVTKLHKHAFQIANTECAEQSDQLRTKFMEIHMFLRLLLFLFVFYGILNGSPKVSRTTCAIFELFFQNNTVGPSFGFHVRKISQLWNVFSKHTFCRFWRETMATWKFKLVIFAKSERTD